MMAILPISFMPNLEFYFAADGALAQFVPDYRMRVQQLEMA